MKLIRRMYLVVLVGSLLVVSHSSVVRAELVGYWPMDEGEGETVADQSGNDLTGYFVGVEPPKWIDGKIGGGLIFNAELDEDIWFAVDPFVNHEAAHVRVPDESGVLEETSNENIEKLRFTVDDSFTAMAWVFIPDEPRVGWQGLVTKGRDTSPTAWWGLWENGESHWAYGEADNNLQGQTLGLDSVELGAWTHFAIQQNAEAGTLSMYLNGEEVGVHDGVVPQDSPGDLVFAGAGGTAGTGGGGCCDGEFFAGGLDEVRVYNEALSLEAIQMAMNGITETVAGDCNGDGVADAADLACVSTIDDRDAVLGALGTLPGDLDGDGEVAFADFLTLSANFAQEVGYNLGNIDLVDDVAFADFLTLSGNFGKTPAGAAASVPEPSGSLLVAIGLLGLTRRRR